MREESGIIRKGRDISVSHDRKCAPYLVSTIKPVSIVPTCAWNLTGVFEMSGIILRFTPYVFTFFPSARRTGFSHFHKAVVDSSLRTLVGVILLAEET